MGDIPNPAIENQSSPVPLINIDDPKSRYSVLTRLTKGGMAEIFTIHDSQKDVDVLAKRVEIGRKSDDPKDFQRLVGQLQQEARLQANLHHPAIVRTYDLVTDNDANLYIVMENMNDRGYTSVKDLIKSDRLEINDMKTILTELDNVMTYLSQQTPRVFHRDIKPSNILYNRDAKNGIHVKLLDFGIANVVDTTNEAAGSASFVPPEQYLVAGETEATEVYTLALLTCAMINKISPQAVFDNIYNRFFMRLPVQITPTNMPPYHQNMQNRLKQLQIDPSGFLQVVNTALETAKDIRYQTRAEFLAELFQALDTPPSPI